MHGFEGRDVRQRSRGMICPSFALAIALEREGAGNAGCYDRTRSLAYEGRKYASSLHRYAEQSGIPCAMAYGLSRALPGVPGFVATVARKIIACELDPSVGAASGDQDHTT
jgi:hypothetical protein